MTTSRKPGHRNGRRAALAVAALGSSVLAFCPAAGAASAPARGPAVHRALPRAQFTAASTAPTRLRYAVAEPACARPAAHEVACDAVHLRPAARGTRGALAYRVPAASSGPSGGFTPAQLAGAYRFNPGVTVHQTVAVVDAYDDPQALHDLNAFDAHYGIPAETAASFAKVNQRGKRSPLPAANSSWSGEIALDIETVRAVCHTCRILLVEADAPRATDLAAAVNSAARLKATEITNSYGAPERADEPRSVAAAYNHPGVVITASTGDHGWYDWDYANDGSTGASDNAPNTPAAYPTVVAVAGTALALNGDGSRHAEEVWNENGADDTNGLVDGFWLGSQGASGGGCSKIHAAPSWQAGAGGYAATGCGSKRAVGDVAALADPYTGFDVYDTYESGWVTTGGTSLASPLVAAMWALAGGAGGVRYPAQSLYDNLHFRPAAVYDVTVGGNSFCAGDSTTTCSNTVRAQTTPPTGNPNNIGNGNSQYPDGWAGLLDCGYDFGRTEKTIPANTQCNAVSGYDGTSGVGAPDGLTAFRPTRPTVAISRPTALKLGRAQAWTVSRFTDPVPGARAASYHWAWGDGTSSTSTTARTVHRFTRAGTHRVSVQVVDSVGQTGSAAAAVTIGVRPTAVVSGPTALRHGARRTWSSAASKDTNTGGRIVAWSWRVGSRTVGRSSRLVYTFARKGTATLTLAISDNTGLKSTRSVRIRVT